MYPWKEVRQFFLSKPANFPAPDRIGRNFPTVQNCLKKKGKNFI